MIFVVPCHERIQRQGENGRKLGLTEFFSESNRCTPLEGKFYYNGFGVELYLIFVVKVLTHLSPNKVN